MSDLHSKYRDQLINCEVYPIGSRPDGSAVTGFLAWDKKTEKSFLLIFRERHSQEEKVTITLPFSSAVNWQKIAGAGTVQGIDRGVISVELPQKQYLFAESI